MKNYENQDIFITYKKEPGTPRTGCENRTCPGKTGRLVTLP